MSAPAKRWRLLLYSDPKVGKTTLAETAVGPRLIIDAEGGTDWLVSETIDWNPADPPPRDLDSNVSVVAHVTNWDDLLLVNGWLQSGDHEFRSVILDSLTELQKQCKYLISPEKFERGDWDTLYTKMDPVLRSIRDLTKHRTNPVWTVVITALANTKEGKTLPDIQGSMQRSLAGQIDTIGYLRQTDLRPDGTRSRELVIDGNTALYAGDRTKKLMRAFRNGIPVDLNEETDEIEWNLSQLLRFLNDG